MFNLRRTSIAIIASWLAASILTACGGKRADLELSVKAGEAITNADNALDRLSSKPTVVTTDTALGYVTPFLADVNRLATPAPKGSFAVTDVRESYIPGGYTFVGILDEIACAYEENACWDKAADVWKRAIDFANAWNKCHPWTTDRVNAQKILYLYSNLARSFVMSGNKDEAIQTLRSALNLHHDESGQINSALAIQLAYYLYSTKKPENKLEAKQLVDERSAKLQEKHSSENDTDASNLQNDFREIAQNADIKLDAFRSMSGVLSLERKRALLTKGKLFKARINF